MSSTAAPAPPACRPRRPATLSPPESPNTYSVTINWTAGVPNTYGYAGIATGYNVEVIGQGGTGCLPGTTSNNVTDTVNTAGTTSVTIPVFPDQSYMAAVWETSANGESPEAASAYHTSPGAALATPGAPQKLTKAVATPMEVGVGWTASVLGNPLVPITGYYVSLDGGTWTWAAQGSAATGSEGFSGTFAVGSAHTLSVKAASAYGFGPAATTTVSITPPAGPATIGIGTGTGTSAPYIGAGPASETTTDAPGQWVYPAIPVAPGGSITENMLVENTGTASEVATISGSSAEIITAASASLGASKYVLQPAFADGGTLGSGAYLGNTASDSMPASWITSTSSGLTLTWDQETTIPVTVKVPAGTKPGTYYGVMYATVTGAKGTGITSAVQSGVRAYITVS